jgi:DNA repair ATPase RecN
MVAIEHCMDEMKELSYGNFRKMCQKNIETMGKYELLKEQERDYMAKIKQVTDEMKKASDENIKELHDNDEDIKKLKKKVNECKTESELFV